MTNIKIQQILDKDIIYGDDLKDCEIMKANSEITSEEHILVLKAFIEQQSKNASFLETKRIQEKMEIRKQLALLTVRINNSSI